jgi:hypothetical protein
MNTFDSIGFNFDMLCHTYGWLQKKRELSEKVLSDFIKFL